jgi:polyhydroxyalkanoate synthesis repressor PhaR
MTNQKTPVTIKKYANRRLYNTGTSVYVTLEDLAEMVKKGEDFLVYDAKSGDDITRSVLTQIIFEQEGKGGQSLLPITFLRQLIRFYGDSMQMLVPSYLEFTIDKLTSEQDKFRDHATRMFGTSPLAGQMFVPLEEQTRKNMAMFTQALSVFNPFKVPVPGAPIASTPTIEGTAAEPAPSANELDDIRRQLSDMQRRLEGLNVKES